MLPKMLDLASLEAGYREGLTPLQVIDEVLHRISVCSDRAIWISRVPDDALRAAATALMAQPAGQRGPLWGIPFAVKDNIDCAGLQTTAGCPDYAYAPAEDAPLVARLRAAGALLVGKTNLDQFATGLNGTRSPYGAPRCVFDARYISGGSSSGSAVAVASGLVSFALGTDTAGSGRVPAAFNNLIGIKPTRGLLPTRGVVPACRSLDCVTVFGTTVTDGDRVRRLLQGLDAADPYSFGAQQRPLPAIGFRFGVLPPSERDFDGDADAEALYDAAIDRLAALGGIAVDFDYSPFKRAADLLYAGPWVAERLSALREFLDAKPDAFDASVRTILEAARRLSAADVFDGLHALRVLRQQADAQWRNIDLMLLPTAPTIYTVDQLADQPLELNARLGRYTNFVNLLDCCAVAVPAGFRRDGLPFGVTVIAPGGTDDALAALAERLHRRGGFGLGGDRAATIPKGTVAPVADGWLSIAVVGAHLSGMPLNRELTEVGGVLLKCARTAPDYRLYALPDTQPRKPGLVRVAGSVGEGIEVEVWSLPAAAFGAFVARIPAPLGIGKLQLADGESVSGFLCESHAVVHAEDVTRFGGWRAYIASLESEKMAP